VQKCPLCGEPCPGSHFHALEDPSTNHLCGTSEHKCVEPGTRQHRLCSFSGACAIEGELEKVRKRFQGKRDAFEYDYVTRQTMRRHVCTKKIPPDQLTHEGPCSCGKGAEEHLCGEACPQCVYRCHLVCSFSRVRSRFSIAARRNAVELNKKTCNVN
jgi:hypothetical protein